MAKKIGTKHEETPVFPRVIMKEGPEKEGDKSLFSRGTFSITNWAETTVNYRRKKF